MGTDVVGTRQRDSGGVLLKKFAAGCAGHAEGIMRPLSEGAEESRPWPEGERRLSSQI